MHKLSLLDFETSRNQYIMDSETSKVVMVDTTLKYIIHHFYEESKEELYESISRAYPSEIDSFESQYKYAQSLIDMGLFYKRDIAESNVMDKAIQNGYFFRGNVSQLVLVVTEKCNLRCEYCIYSDKYPKEMGYTNEEMNLETAKRAVDIFFEVHAERKLHGLKRTPGICFYGGEPFLNFPLIKEIVEYAKQIDNETIFYITTNGTLLNSEIIDFLTQNNILITFSLDGFKENHDRNRVYENGNPTFDTIINNINKLQKRKKELGIERVISFNCCYDFYTDFSKTVDFFMSHYDSFHPFFIHYNQINPFDTEYFDWCSEQERSNPNWSFLHNNLEHSLQEINENIYGTRVISEKYMEIVSMLLLSEFSFVIRDQEERSFLKNCCVPTSKLAVSPDGTMTFCEKMCKRLPIGNSKTGIDWDEVDRLTKKLGEFFSNEKCSSCPVRAMCDACFMYMDEDGSINPEYCEKKQTTFPKILSNLYSHLEEGVDYVAIYKKKQEFSALKETLI